MANVTKDDASKRVLDARVCSLLDPTTEYLEALRIEVWKWLESIEKECVEKGI